MVMVQVHCPPWIYMAKLMLYKHLLKSVDASASYDWSDDWADTFMQNVAYILISPQ